MVLRSFLILVLSFARAYGCDCSEPPVPFKKDHADVVFRGTIIALRDSKKAVGAFAKLGQDTKKTVVFRVNRVWKGEVGQTFEMPAVEETMACIGFWPSILRVGNDILVYATRSEASEYYTSICGWHKLTREAKDFQELGAGKEPRQRSSISK